MLAATLQSKGVPAGGHVPQDGPPHVDGTEGLLGGHGGVRKTMTEPPGTVSTAGSGGPSPRVCRPDTARLMTLTLGTGPQLLIRVECSCGHWLWGPWGPSCKCPQMVLDTQEAAGVGGTVCQQPPAGLRAPGIQCHGQVSVMGPSIPVFWTLPKSHQKGSDDTVTVEGNVSGC